MPTATASAVPFPPTGPARPLPVSRSLQFVLFLAAIFWYFCAQALATDAASIIEFRFDLGSALPLVQAILLLFFLVCGLALLRAIEGRRAPLRLTLGLPRRATWRTEWAIGTAIGWGLAVAVVLPMALARALYVQLWTAPRAFMLLGGGLLTLALATLAHALAIYGYGFQRLIDATGPVPQAAAKTMPLEQLVERAKQGQVTSAPTKEVVPTQQPAVKPVQTPPPGGGSGGSDK